MSLSRSRLAIPSGIRSGRCCWQNSWYGLVNVFLAGRAEADSGAGAGLLGGPFLGGALSGADDLPDAAADFSLSDISVCWKSTAEANAAALAGAAEGIMGA